MDGEKGPMVKQLNGKKTIQTPGKMGKMVKWPKVEKWRSVGQFTCPLTLSGAFGK
jgi:hypothetical protein